MKKIVFALASAAVLLSSAPALAGPNANDVINSQSSWMAQQTVGGARYRDHSYGGYSYSYSYSNSYYAPPLIAGTLGLVGSLIAGNPHKPANGELRTLPDGTTVSYDKRSNTWILVNRPPTQPRAVYTNRDEYAAQ